MTSLAVVIPIKRLSRAKTRLKLPRADRRRMALEMALHAVGVAARTPEVTHVVVVTRDRTVARKVRPLGAWVLREPRRSTLNSAAAAGRDRARKLAATEAVAIMVSDLPDLLPEHISAVLSEFEVARTPMVVVDHEGTGTTMLLHRSDENPPIRFGPGSALAHQAAGYSPAQAALTGLRHDFDTLPTDSPSVGGD